MFPKIVGFLSPQIIHFNRVFHYKPSILEYPHCWKHPFVGFPVVVLQKKIGKLVDVPRQLLPTADTFREGDVSQAQVHAQFRAIVFLKKIVPFKGTTRFYTKIGWKFLECHFFECHLFVKRMIDWFQGEASCIVENLDELNA